MRFDVVTFGSAVVDAFVGTEQRGEKFEYKVGSKILIRDLKFDVGGGATNSAVAFVRLGLRVGCICNVGDDNNGDDVLSSLKSERVKFLGKRVRGKTGYSVILDSRDKDRTILTFKGPGNSVSLRDVGKFDADWLYFSSVLGESFRTQIKLAKRMKKGGTKLAFNPSEYLIKAKNIRGLLRLSDVVVLNREEFDLIGEKYGRSLLEICSGVVVVTNKDKKAVAFSRKSEVGSRKSYGIVPHKIKVVERTGAGDAFASGFVAGQIVGWDIDKCLELGLRESEAVIGFFGAKNKLLKRKLQKQTSGFGRQVSGRQVE